VRCQIIKLSAGGLFVNNPIAPTPEAIELVREIEQQTGEEVKYVNMWGYVVCCMFRCLQGYSSLLLLSCPYYWCTRMP